MIDISKHPGIHFLLWRFGMATALTQTTIAERNCLHRHASGRRRLAEIGVWHGVNTRSLKAVMAPDGILFAIDPFPPSKFGFSWQMSIAHGEVHKESNGRVEFLRMTSANAAAHLAVVDCAPLDFVFVDGDHSYEGLQTDWQLWAPTIMVGGIIALHDSRSHAGRSIDHAGSVRFTQEIILTDPRFTAVDAVDSLTILVRNCTVQAPVLATQGGDISEVHCRNVVRS